MVTSERTVAGWTETLNSRNNNSKTRSDAELRAAKRAYHSKPLWETSMPRSGEIS
jgi:hypothetical protein